jgi:glutamine synthetase
MITLNSAVAEALASFKKRVDERISKYSEKTEYSEGSGHSPKYHAIIDVLREDIKTCKPIRFDGNGYSEEWKAEAARRGLDVETSCPVIFERYLDESSIQMFESLGVMTKKELKARNEVKWETYTKKIQIEARVLGDLSMNHIIPVATNYQGQLLRNVERMSGIFSKEKASHLNARNLKLIEEIAQRTAIIETKVEELVAARKVANKIEDEHAKAVAYHDTIAPMFDEIRYQIDKLELIVDDALWPLPKYRELLFIR